MRRSISTSVDLTKILERNKSAVDDYIFKFLPRDGETPEIAVLYRMMRDYPARPGKGLRSSLCLLTCKAFGGRTEDAMVTAAALELFHNWMLIHDDVEDMSEMRRGTPVLHHKYGVPLAINAGDALHGRMWDLLMRNREVLGDRKTLEILQEFQRAVNETTEGQHMELAWVHRNRWDLDEENYMEMCKKKTSWFTCISPCTTGAIIAEADRAEVQSLIPFGAELGVAFQIQDDILNLIGKEARYGKEIAGDIWEGKRTLILIRLLNVCSKQDYRSIIAVMNKSRKEKSRDEVLKILELMKKYGAIEYAQKVAERLAESARHYLSKVSKSFRNQEAKDALFAIVDFMIRRDW